MDGSKTLLKIIFICIAALGICSEKSLAPATEATTPPIPTLAPTTTPALTTSPAPTTTPAPTTSPTPTTTPAHTTTPAPTTSPAHTTTSDPTATPPPTQATTPPGQPRHYYNGCECGIRNDRGTIVYGKRTLKNEFPWQVGLVRHGFKLPFCGGSIISVRTVLTAAQCTIRKAPNDILVLVGEHDTRRNDGDEIWRVRQIINHPHFVAKNKDYDYSLLILKYELTWNKKVHPVCLPVNSESFYENKEAIITGWGKLRSGAAKSKILQKGKVTTMTNTACTRGTHYHTGKITSSMICAAEKNKDSCQGDVGGPLVFQEATGTYSVIGVKSWGRSCAQASAPGVYARVTAAIGWILGHSQGHVCYPMVNRCSETAIGDSCRCNRDWRPVCAGGITYGTPCDYDCKKKKAQCAGLQGFPKVTKNGQC